MDVKTSDADEASWFDEADEFEEELAAQMLRSGAIEVWGT